MEPSRRLFDVALALLLVGAGEEGTLRRRAYELVAQTPGLHQREIARRLDVRPSHAEHHLRSLAKAGLLREERAGGYLRYFARVSAPGQTGPRVPGAADARKLALLRQPRPLHVVALLLHDDALPLGRLAQEVGVAPGTLTYHLDKLEEAGIVHRIQHGAARSARLIDRDATLRMLLDYEAPDDLVAGFEDLFEDLGLS